MKALKSIIQGTFSPCMADVPTLSPELCRNVSTLARTLVAAPRRLALGPPERPVVRRSLTMVRHPMRPRLHQEP
jgi:hypothetical protein